MITNLILKRSNRLPIYSFQTNEFDPLISMLYKLSPATILVDPVLMSKNIGILNNKWLLYCLNSNLNCAIHMSKLRSQLKKNSGILNK